LTKQIEDQYNKEHGINPVTVFKSIEEIMSSTSVADVQSQRILNREDSKQARIKIASEPLIQYMSKEQKQLLVEELFIEMKNYASNLDFERAAEIRDEIRRLKEDIDSK